MANTRIESPVGARNGINTLFTVARPYAPGSAAHFLNGVLHDPILADGLVESDPAIGEVTLKEAPGGPLGSIGEEKLLILYEDASGILQGTATVAGSPTSTLLGSGTNWLTLSSSLLGSTIQIGSETTTVISIISETEMLVDPDLLIDGTGLLVILLTPPVTQGLVEELLGVITPTVQVGAQLQQATVLSAKVLPPQKVLALLEQTAITGRLRPNQSLTAKLQVCP